MSRTERIIIGCFTAYSIAALVAFGPAVVEEDRAAAAREAECLAHNPGNAAGCGLWVFNYPMPAMKAVCWPLWLSVKIARSAS
ncbi:MAG: hypothetical protein AB9M53_01120 [Leptothrix sp. (in: b-proteobacteria)]